MNMKSGSGFDVRLLWLVLLFAPDLWAALPAPTLPSTAPGADDWLAIIKGYIKDGSAIIGLFLSVAGFLWLGWNALSDLNEVRIGKKEWGAAGLGNVAGAAIFLWVSYMLTKASGVI
jgi:integrating conjugative element membrane protein (TIGR03745 family)